jgi:hypothetical protein
VLHKVDADSNADLKIAIKDWWQKLQNDKSQHPIFFEFIELERNNILKEYELGMFSGEVNVLISTTGESFTLTETAFCPMSYGAFEGEDCRDIALQAIEWWEAQIDVIENSLP